MHELVILFLSAFFAATLLPVQSELVLAVLYLSGEYSPGVLMLTGTLGNVLGSVVNWWLGSYLIHFKEKKWFPIKEKAIKKAERIYQKWGVWSLLFAWMPVIGDPLTLLAGVFQVRLSMFLLLVIISKAGRYMVVLWLVPLA